MTSSNLDATSWRISHLRQVFWCSPPKMGRMGVRGGPSAKWRHGGCGMAPSKTAGTGVPSPPGACFMQIPASESLLFFPSQKGQIPAGFGEAAKPTCL